MYRKMKPSTSQHRLHWHALMSVFQSNSHHFPTGSQNSWQRQSFPVYAPISSPSVTKQFPLTLTSFIFSTKFPYFKDMNSDHLLRACLCILAGDAKGMFSTVLTATTRTHNSWSQQSGKHSTPQRWVWHLRMLHDMQAQHFIRLRDFGWASSANALHFQAHCIRKCIKVSKLLISTIRSLAKKGTSVK